LILHQYIISKVGHFRDARIKDPVSRVLPQNKNQMWSKWYINENELPVPQMDNWTNSIKPLPRLQMTYPTLFWIGMDKLD